MKSFTLTVFLIFISIIETFAVPAYPFPIQYKQPDGSELTIQLKGDEMVHWAETTDGYTLLSNGNNGWEYAVSDASGDIKASGILAKEINKRNNKELKLLKGISKNMHFSPKQVKMLTSFWNISSQNPNGIQKVSGMQKVFNPNGSKKLLMILIGFPDLQFTKSKADFQALMNQTGYNLNGAKGSVKDFFLEMSYNNFNITTDVVGIYTANNNMAYYGANAVNGSHDVNGNELITEAVQKASADVNFADYDNDNDGTVDGVYVIYAGYGEATSGIANTIWPHASNIPTLTYNGKTISKYSCSNELTYSRTDITTIGVICHEFGHVCGAADYYDTDNATGGQYWGTGYWDLMANGVYNGTPSGCSPAHFNPYEKIKSGWATPVLLSENTTITIPDITTNATIYKYNTTSPNEYFLIENRQQNGFNTYVPGHGLMIYHYSNYEGSATRNKTAPQNFYPVCANAPTSPTINSGPSSYGNINSAGCPFPGSSNKSGFYDSGTPSSKSWAGNNTGFPITNITENAIDHTVNFKFSTVSECTSAPTLQANSFVVNSIGFSTANISWTRGNGDKVIVVAHDGSAVDLDPLNGNAYIANSTFKLGDEIGSGNYVVYNGTGTSVNIDGLVGGTNYYFSVYEYNAADKCYLKPALAGNATTNCNINAATYIEDFEHNTFGCWTTVDNTGQGSWNIGTTSSNLALNLSGNYAYFKGEYGVAHDYNTDLISPTFDLSAYSNVNLKFKHLYDASTVYRSLCSLYYSIDNGATWNLIETYNTDQNNLPVSVSISAAAGQSQVKFKWNYSCSPTGAFLWAIDDVQVIDNSYFWTGAIDSDWFKANNWSTNSIPTSTSSAVIPAAPANQPQIDASNAECLNLKINSGATLSMNNGTAYTLSVSGDWVNNGTFNAGLGTVDFNGTNNLQTISGTSTTTFNALNVSKGTQSKVLEVKALIALGATNPLIINSGTFKLSSASTITPFTSSATIGSNAGLWNNGGTITAGAYGWTLNAGLLRISAGTVNIGTTSDNGLTYVNNGSINIEGGVLNVAGRISPNSGTSTGSYTQSGGEVNLMTIGSANTTRGAFELNSGVPFTMSGGKITIQKATSNSTADVIMLSTTNNITGGTLQIGNTNTTENQVLRINSSVPVYNLTLNSNGSPTCQLLSNLTILNALTINTGTTFTVNAGKQLTATTSMTNNGILNLLSDETYGNATILTPETIDGNGTGNVQQYLKSARNWYISSPVTGAIATAGNTYYKFIEAENNGSTWTPVAVGTIFTKMTGYILQSNAPKTFTFSGKLNTGAQSITNLTSTALAKSGYNLVGNPYPSYVNWASVFAHLNTTNIGTSIWYRTKNMASTPVYVYDTFNKTGNIGTNNNGAGAVTALIPPMQAFWVKVNNGTTGSLAFENSMRSHQDVSSNKFRVTANNEAQQVLRLQISNGMNSDEAIILFNSQAENEIDAFDSPKMTNNNASIPEIYTFAGNEKLTINGLKSISTNYSIALGFTTESSNSLSIKAFETSNFNSDTKIIIRDNLLGIEQDITDGTPYNFTSQVGSTDSRFEIIFKTNAMIDDLENRSKEELFTITKNANHQMIVTTNLEYPSSTLTITNTIGQKLYSKKINTKSTVIDMPFETGVYFVTLTGGNKTITRKVIIN